MEAGVVVAIVSAVAIPAAGILVSWGALGIRIRSLETLPERLEALNTRLTAIDARTAASAASQGTRLETAQRAIDHLEGQMVGFERGVSGSVQGWWLRCRRLRRR